MFGSRADTTLKNANNLMQAQNYILPIGNRILLFLFLVTLTLITMTP